MQNKKTKDIFFEKKFIKKDFEIIDQDFKIREFRNFLIVNNILEINDIQYQNQFLQEKDEWGLFQNDYIYIKSRLALRYCQMIFLKLERIIKEKEQFIVQLRSLKKQYKSQLKQQIKLLRKKINQ